MQKETFKYNPEKKCLEEQPVEVIRGGKPVKVLIRSFAPYEKYIWDKNDYTPGPREIPTPHTDWPEGELREGRDFIVQDKEYETGDTIYGIKVAVPLSPSNSQEGEEEINVKAIPEIAELDAVINTYVSMQSLLENGSFKNIQNKFWEAIEALNKYKLSKRI